MGMYTEIYINADLKPTTPQEIIDVLSAMCSDDIATDFECMKDKPNRWKYLFHSGSCYTPDTSCRELKVDHSLNILSIIGKGDIKNYYDEIEQFFEFIAPWCDDDFIGYHRYEESREPTLIYASEVCG